MKLTDIKVLPFGPATEALYEILREREGEDSINISHQRMPTFEEHRRFVESHPYEAWYLIELEPADWAVGSIYLTKPAPQRSQPGNEIGIFIRKAYRGQGLGKKAVQLLMAYHGERPYLANINPRNEASIGLFTGLGFWHIQNTYRLERA